MTTLDTVEDEKAPENEELYRELTQLAVEAFWNKRSLAKQKAIDEGATHEDESLGVRNGQNLHAFNDLLAAVLKAEGVPPEDVIFEGNDLTIPGYYRYSKSWDVIIRDRKKNIVGAIEFKSLVGGRQDAETLQSGKESRKNSIGSNLNNRLEESIGSVTDLHRARDNKNFASNKPFFTGWVMVIEEHHTSVDPPKDRFGVYKRFRDADPLFENTSYIDRANLFCRRSVSDELYNSTALIVTKRPAPGEQAAYRDAAEDTSIKNFIRELSLFARNYASDEGQLTLY